MYIAIYKILGEHSSRIMYSLNSRRIKLNNKKKNLTNAYRQLITTMTVTG